MLDPRVVLALEAAIDADSFVSHESSRVVVDLLQQMVADDIPGTPMKYVPPKPKDELPDGLLLLHDAFGFSVMVDISLSECGTSDDIKSAAWDYRDMVYSEGFMDALHSCAVRRKIDESRLALLIQVVGYLRNRGRECLAKDIEVLILGDGQTEDEGPAMMSDVSDAWCRDYGEDNPNLSDSSGWVDLATWATHDDDFIIARLECVPSLGAHGWIDITTDPLEAELL